MSIPYPKQTKAELIRLLIARDEELKQLRLDAEATRQTAINFVHDLRDEVRALRAKLKAATDRQRFESMAYRAKLKKANAEAKPVSDRRKALMAAREEAMRTGKTVSAVL